MDTGETNEKVQQEVERDSQSLGEPTNINGNKRITEASRSVSQDSPNLQEEKISQASRCVSEGGENLQDKETYLILSQEDVDKSKSDLELSQKREKSLEDSLSIALKTIEELKTKVELLEVKETEGKIRAKEAEVRAEAKAEGKAEGVAECMAVQLENAQIKVLELEHKELKTEMEALKVQFHNLDLESARQNTEIEELKATNAAILQKLCSGHDHGSKGVRSHDKERLLATCRKH